MPVVQSNPFLMNSLIARALNSEKLGQTIQSEWPPQAMSSLQWHDHMQTNLLCIAPAIHHCTSFMRDKKKIQQLNSTMTLHLKPTPKHTIT
jgi:hypothetical protein